MDDLPLSTGSKAVLYADNILLFQGMEDFHYIYIGISQQLKDEFKVVSRKTNPHPAW